MDDWRVRVRFGDLLDLSGQPGELIPRPWDGGPLLVAAGWHVELVDDTWPAAPAIPTGRVQLLVREARTLDQLVENVPVEVSYYSPAAAAEPLAVFGGRVTDVELEPVPEGTVASYVLTGHKADLAAYTVGAAARPVERRWQRLAAWAVDAGLSIPGYNNLFYRNDAELTARDGSPWTFLDAVTKYHREAVHYAGLLGRPAPGGDPDGLFGTMTTLEPDQHPDDPLGDVGWVQVEVPRVYETWAVELVPYPDGLWRPGVDADDPAGHPSGSAESVTIDGGYVESSGRWTRWRALVPTRVEVVTAAGTGVADSTDPGQLPVVWRFDTELTNVDDGTLLAEWILSSGDDTPPGGAWQADEWTIPSEVIPSGWWPAELWDVAVVTRLDPARTPGGQNYSMGVVVAVDAAWAAGRGDVTVTAAPRPLARVGQNLTYDGIPFSSWATPGGPSWDQLGTDFDYAAWATL